MNAYGDNNDESGNFYQPGQLSAPKHATPGPWMAASSPSSIVGWPVIAAGGRLICTIATPPNNLRRIGKEAANYEAYLKECGLNARLIAASPDMLAALIQAKQFILNGTELGFIRMPGSGTPDPAHDMLPAIEAAIAKAVQS